MAQRRGVPDCKGKVATAWMGHDGPARPSALFGLALI